jgi:hypothetical protein
MNGEVEIPNYKEVISQAFQAISEDEVQSYKNK